MSACLLSVCVADALGPVTIIERVDALCTKPICDNISDLMDEEMHVWINPTMKTDESLNSPPALVDCKYAYNRV